MQWTTLEFGKHKDKTLPQILFSDPDWFFWAVKNDVFKNRPLLRAQAAELLRKAKSIRIPQKGSSEKLVVEHFVHRPTMKYSHFDLVPESKPAHQGASPTMRAQVIDMSFPTLLSNYDKTGSKLLVDSLKKAYFGDKPVRMTKERCEAFFSDDKNFEG